MDLLDTHQRQELAKRERNLPALARRLASFDKRAGARVGDFIRLPDIHPKLGQWTRITHDHGDLLQTGGGAGGSYYLGNGYLSYSGGLDHGVTPDCLLATDQTKEGSVWFFDGEMSGAGRGVDFTAPMRVFTLREGTDLSGISELQCPYRLDVRDAAMRAHYQNTYGCGSERNFYGVTLNSYHKFACVTREELDTWLAANGLRLSKPITHDVASYQSLAYV